MKKGLLLPLLGTLLVAGSLVVYALRLSRCYTGLLPADPQALAAFRNACLFDQPIVTQFSAFLALILPGLGLICASVLLTRPAVRRRRGGMLSLLLLIMLLDSLLVSLYGFLGYPPPGASQAPSGWAALCVAALGLLMVLSILALWHWKRWGLALFQGSAIALAIFILVAGGSVILSAVLVGGAILLSLLLRSVRQHLA